MLSSDQSQYTKRLTIVISQGLRWRPSRAAVRGGGPWRIVLWTRCLHRFWLEGVNWPIKPAGENRSSCQKPQQVHRTIRPLSPSFLNPDSRSLNPLTVTVTLRSTVDLGVWSLRDCIKQSTWSAEPVQISLKQEFTCNLEVVLKNHFNYRESHGSISGIYSCK